MSTTTLLDLLRRVAGFLLHLFTYAIRARQVRVVATWEARTVDNKEGKCAWKHVTSFHIVSLLIDRNGRRFSQTDTTSETKSEEHIGVRLVRTNWREHGDIPDDARRVDNRPRGKLVAFPGGRGGDAA